MCKENDLLKKQIALEKLFRDKNKIKLLYMKVDKKIKDYGLQERMESFEGKDLVQDIVEQLLKEERSWDIDKYPDTFRQILLIADGKIKNEYEKKKNRYKAGTRYIDDDKPIVENISEEDYRDSELRNEKEEQILKMEKEISKMDDIDKLIYEEYKKKKPYSEIAKACNLEEKDITNWRKRVLRHFNNSNILDK